MLKSSAKLDRSGDASFAWMKGLVDEFKIARYCSAILTMPDLFLLLLWVDWVPFDGVLPGKLL
jgi:hypothetical protein